jgi:hypothetical protein
LSEVHVRFVVAIEDACKATDVAKPPEDTPENDLTLCGLNREIATGRSIEIDYWSVLVICRRFSRSRGLSGGLTEGMA